MLSVIVTDWLPLLLAGIGGLGVCILGLRGRREGDEPHCRKCAYNLTGLTSQRCPECGSPILPDGTVYGTLRRRWPLLVSGALLLSLCTWSLGSLAYAHLRMIDFQAHYPFGWLLTSARRGEGASFLELIKREKSGLLSVHEVNRLVETALAAAEQDLPCGRLNGWLKLLSRWDEDDVFTLEQRARFYSSLHRLVTPTIKGPLRIPERRVGNMWVRKKGPQRVRSGGRLVIPVAHRCSGPFNIYVTGYELTVAGKVLPISPPRWGGKLPRSVCNRDWPWDLSVPNVDIEPGLHTLEFRGKYMLLRPGKWLEGSNGVPFATDEKTAFASVEVLPAFDPGLIGLVADPAMGELIAQAIKLQAIRAYHVSGVRHKQTVGSLLREMIKLRSTQTSDTGEANAKTSIRVPLRLEQPLPIAVAFDVLLRLPGGDVHVGMVAWPRKAELPTRCATGEIPAIDAREALVVLRTNPEAARPYLEITQVWDGEIVLGPEYVWYEEHRSFKPRLMSPRVIPPPVNRP